MIKIENHIDLTIHAIKSGVNIGNRVYFNGQSVYEKDNGNEQEYAHDLKRRLYSCEYNQLIDTIMEYQKRNNVVIDNVIVYLGLFNALSFDCNVIPKVYTDDIEKYLMSKNGEDKFKCTINKSFKEMLNEYESNPKNKKDCILINRFGWFYGGYRLEPPYGHESHIWTLNFDQAKLETHDKLYDFMYCNRKWMKINGADGYNMNNTGIVKPDYIKSLRENAQKAVFLHKTYSEYFAEMFNKGCKYKYMSPRFADYIDDAGRPYKMITDW